MVFQYPLYKTPQLLADFTFLTAIRGLASAATCSACSAAGNASLPASRKVSKRVPTAVVGSLAISRDTASLVLLTRARVLLQQLPHHLAAPAPSRHLHTALSKVPNQPLDRAALGESAGGGGAGGCGGCWGGHGAHREEGGGGGGEGRESAAAAEVVGGGGKGGEGRREGGSRGEKGEAEAAAAQGGAAGGGEETEAEAEAEVEEAQLPSLQICSKALTACCTCCRAHASSPCMPVSRCHGKESSGGERERDETGQEALRNGSRSRGGGGGGTAAVVADTLQSSHCLLHLLPRPCLLPLQAGIALPWAWGMGHGAWGMGHRAWGMGHGAWGMGHGAWGMGHGAWALWPTDLLRRPRRSSLPRARVGK
ncbi:unnamed protein product [Closterium sp. NIES-54]